MSLCADASGSCSTAAVVVWTGGVGNVADLGIRFDFLNGEVPRKLDRPLESGLRLDAREVDETRVGSFRS